MRETRAVRAWFVRKKVARDWRSARMVPGTMLLETGAVRARFPLGDAYRQSLFLTARRRIPLGLSDLSENRRWRYLWPSWPLRERQPRWKTPGVDKALLGKCFAPGILAGCIADLFLELGWIAEPLDLAELVIDRVRIVPTVILDSDRVRLVRHPSAFVGDGTPQEVAAEVLGQLKDPRNTDGAVWIRDCSASLCGLRMGLRERFEMHPDKFRVHFDGHTRFHVSLVKDRPGYERGERRG